MDWIRDVVLSLVMTSVTGDILVFIWMSVVYFSRGKLAVHYVYLMLKWVPAGYLFTLIYLALHRYREYVRNEFDALYGGTIFLDRLVFVLFLVWILGMVVQVVSQFKIWRCFRQIKGSCITVPGEYAALLEKMCTEMKIRRPVSLRQGYGVRTPFICGVRKPGIFLPAGEFSMEGLEMVLYHELVHFKQGDTFWKPVFGLLGNIYWFSPLSKILWREAVRWTEANCDFYCCEKKFDARRYFMLLLDMGSTGRQANTYAPMWTEGSKELKWRINCMKKHRNQKTYLSAAIAVAVVSVACCGASVYASTQGIRTIYGRATISTLDGMEETQDTEELQEYHGTEEEFAGMEVVQHQEEGMETYSNVATIDDWEIGNNAVHYSNGFKAQAGGYIVVTAGIVPTDRTVKVGIRKPDGKIAYVMGKKVVTYTYNVSKTGTYKVFIGNTSGKKVTATGSYIIN